MPPATMTTLIEQIDQALPQTQCGLCGYAGCLPYAQAIAQGAPINLCPPGGLSGLHQLAQLTQQRVTEAMQEALQARCQPPQVARIRDTECIGCTKCIQACPVDAIIGSAKRLHVILEQDCTGCGLCIAPCPVDCIDLIEAEQLSYQKDRAKQHYHAKLARGAFKRSDHLPTPNTLAAGHDTLISDKKRFIAEAVARAKTKKQSST